MGDKTKIEWTDATWNPVTGCSKVSQGCKFCYAEREFPRVYPGRAFTDVWIHTDRLDIPLRWRRPRRVFVNSMSDLFHDDVPRGFIKSIAGTARDCPQHIFQILTKRPERMLKFCLDCRFPDNVWLGVSVEDQETADERIPLLMQTPAAVRWVSYEPALGPVDFFKWLEPFKEFDPSLTPEPQLDWIVAGGESGPRARPSHPDWFRAVRDECQAAGTPFFFKQWGEWLQLREASGNCVIAPKVKKIEVEQRSDLAQCRVITLCRIGKRLAGRELDGREWNEMPEAR